MRFTKYHALGNDYLVLDPADFPTWREPSAGQTKLICHRNFGVGSDGILWGPLPSSAETGGLACFRVRIFNPDGSEAEKSGNGTRIFSRYLWDRGRVGGDPFVLETLGGQVRSVILEGGRLITMDMGRVSFDSARIPVAGARREVLGERVGVLDREFVFNAATIGNPHCVIVLPEISEELARRYGPALETHPLFPNRTNVQFVRIEDRSNIRIEIWERGAGYTLASGTSSSAAAAVSRRLGLVDSDLTVHMPGGSLEVRIGDDYAITMTGPVTRVAEGEIDPEMLAWAGPPRRAVPAFNPGRRT